MALITAGAVGTIVISPTPVGDVVDVLLSDADMDAMVQYPIIWLLADESPDSAFLSRLRRYVEVGGHLMTGGLPMLTIASEWFGMLILGVLTLLAIGLAITGVINLILASWTAVLIWLTAAALTYLLYRLAATRVPNFDDFLLRVARELEQTLEPTHSVPYIVMGHDHLATMEKLEEAWYVNTGTWVQIFERQGLVEAREKLTFFRHTWGHKGPPELLRWDDAVGEPARLMFGLTD